MSAKNNDKIIKQPAGLCVNIKFVFADQVQIHTSFPSDSPSTTFIFFRIVFFIISSLGFI